jgi:hypothetical protein
MPENMTQPKPFDCIDMMHQGAKRIHEATRRMSRRAELAYWQARAKELLPAAQPAAPHAAVVRENQAAYRVAR